MRPPGNLILQPTLPKSGRILVAPIISRRRLWSPPLALFKQPHGRPQCRTQAPWRV